MRIQYNFDDFVLCTAMVQPALINYSECFNDYFYTVTCAAAITAGKIALCPTREYRFATSDVRTVSHDKSGTQIRLPPFTPSSITHRL